MKVLNTGLESISFQSGDFYKDLVTIIKEARTLKPTKENKEIIGKKISMATMKHTKMLVDVDFRDNIFNAYIVPKFFTPENVLYRNDGRDFFKTYYNSLSSVRGGETIEGWINTATSTVGGEFSKLKMQTVYDTSFVFNETPLSPEGAAAVILHESGHGFTFFQFIADTVMINFVLQQTYQELTEAKTDAEVKMVITRNRKRLNLPNATDWSSESTGKSKETIITVLATEATMERTREDNKRFYTQNTSEELAEVFCVRHGGAAGLIEVRNYFTASRGNLGDFNFGILSSSMLCAGSVLAAVMAPVLAPIAMTAAVLFGVFAFSGAAAAANFPAYTTHAQTIGKIRNQLIERLKEANLPKDVVDETLANLVSVEKSLKEFPKESVPMAVAFFDFFRSEKKKASAWREYTDQLENMATNDLFVRAAKLINMA